MDKRMNSTKFDVYWNELAPREHLLHLYDSEDLLLETLEGFIAGGLRGSDSVVVIATEEHLSALEDRLGGSGLRLDAARKENRYVPFVAEEALEKFMLGNWPDEALFMEFVGAAIRRAQGNGRGVRAFGQMVALLWAQGNKNATIVLEQLWHRLCATSGLSLLCAYPQLSVLGDGSPSQKDIRALHTLTVEN